MLLVRSNWSWSRSMIMTVALSSAVTACAPRTDAWSQHCRMWHEGEPEERLTALRWFHVRLKPGTPRSAVEKCLGSGARGTDRAVWYSESGRDLIVFYRGYPEEEVGAVRLFGE